jgi:nicotinamidase/pyrazinamidase
MKALVLVDLQKDFLPGGSLAVEEGDQVIPKVNNMLNHSFDLVVATQDWHPANHGSFASNHENKKPGDIIDLQGTEQILWPDHCVQNSEGAEFADDLDTEKIDKIIKKGTDPNIDSYSGFYDNEHKKATGLHDYLKQKNIDSLVIAGLAADVCVRFTALDALELGYKTQVVKDATRAVEKEEGYKQTMNELKEKGAELISSEKVAEPG